METWWWLDGSSLVPKTDLPSRAFSYTASGSQIYVAVLRRVLVGALPEDPRAIARSLPPSLAVLVLWLVIGGAVSGGWTGVAWCRRLVTPEDGSSPVYPTAVVGGQRWASLVSLLWIRSRWHHRDGTWRGQVHLRNCPRIAFRVGSCCIDELRVPSATAPRRVPVLGEPLRGAESRWQRSRRTWRGRVHPHCCGRVHIFVD